MQIELSRTQFENLIKLVYLGHWMTNGSKIAEERITHYDDLEQFLYAYAHQNGLGELIEHDEPSKLFLASQKMEESEELEKIKSEYNEEIFWSELIQRLAGRDFLNMLDENQLAKMGDDEQRQKKSDLLKKYAKEFEGSGLENVSLKAE